MPFARHPRVDVAPVSLSAPEGKVYQIREAPIAVEWLC
jgi:hypothetical protein